MVVISHPNKLLLACKLSKWFAAVVAKLFVHYTPFLEPSNWQVGNKVLCCYIFYHQLQNLSVFGLPNRLCSLLQ